MFSFIFKEGSQEKKDSNENFCRYCNKQSPYSGDCYKWNHNEDNWKGQRRSENDGRRCDPDCVDTNVIMAFSKGETK